MTRGGGRGPRTPPSIASTRPHARGQALHGSRIEERHSVGHGEACALVGNCPKGEAGGLVDVWAGGAVGADLGVVGGGCGSSARTNPARSNITHEPLNRRHM